METHHPADRYRAQQIKTRQMLGQGSIRVCGHLWCRHRDLDRDLPSDLDDCVGRQPQDIADVRGIAHHGRIGASSHIAKPLPSVRRTIVSWPT